MALVACIEYMAMFHLECLTACVIVFARLDKIMRAKVTKLVKDNIFRLTGAPA
jgi:hypothetical protein